MTAAAQISERRRFSSSLRGRLPHRQISARQFQPMNTAHAVAAITAAHSAGEKLSLLGAMIVLRSDDPNGDTRLTGHQRPDVMPDKPDHEGVAELPRTEQEIHHQPQ